MNITYIVGNGLDLQYGLKTRYKDFYEFQNKVYISRKENEEEYSNFIYDSLFSDKVNEIFNEISADNIEKINTDSKLLVQTDLDGVIQYANENFKDYFGRGNKSIIGKPIHLFDHPSVPKSVLRHIHEQVNLDDDTNAVFINKTLILFYFS